MKRTVWIMTSLLFMMLSWFSYAGETNIDELYKQALASWEKRGDINEARKALELFRKSAEAKRTNEDLWVKLAIAYYWLGELTPEEKKEERIRLYTEGEKASFKAISINPRSIGGNFWAVVNNGRVTELKGLLSGSFNLGLCLRNMNMTSAQDPRYYYGGVYRYLGRVIYEIPSILKKLMSFSMSDSIYFYQLSLEMEPNFFMTHLYLAESYLANGEKEKARKELLWVINNSPSLLPEAEPENRLYQEKAKALFEKEFRTQVKSRKN